MEWTGDLSERITLPNTTLQEHWVRETGQLTGTTEERMRAWKARFSQPTSVQPRVYDPWTCGDLKKLVHKLREAAGEKGWRIFASG